MKFTYLPVAEILDIPNSQLTLLIGGLPVYIGLNLVHPMLPGRPVWLLR